MVLHLFRAIFILVMAAVGWWYLAHPPNKESPYNWLAVPLCSIVAVALVCIDILSPRKKLQVFSGTILGLLVGISIAYGLSFVVGMVVDLLMPAVETADPEKLRKNLLLSVNLLIGVVCCYLAISFIMQTKDDFRFIIPYVEFRKQTRGPRPVLIDTSVVIDGRILDVAGTGILESQLIIPRFVVRELQAVADSGDRLKRNRGRRGLDMLNRLQNHPTVEVFIYESSSREEGDGEGVDQKLMSLAKQLNARVLTNDFNLGKVAQLNQVDVINLNDLANALKPVVLPGEKMRVRLIKPGEEAAQGVGYLDDGTMVVVDQGRNHINQEVEFTVTSALQTSAGRMIFGRLGDNGLRHGRDGAQSQSASGNSTNA